MVSPLSAASDIDLDLVWSLSTKIALALHAHASSTWGFAVDAPSGTSFRVPGFNPVSVQGLVLAISQRLTADDGISFAAKVLACQHLLEAIKGTNSGLIDRLKATREEKKSDGSTRNFLDYEQLIGHVSAWLDETIQDFSTIDQEWIKIVQKSSTPTPSSPKGP